MCSRALARGPLDNAEDRLLRYLACVPVLQESQIQLLLGFPSSRSMLNRLVDEGLIQVERPEKRAALGRPDPRKGKGKIIWRAGYSASKPLLRSYLEKGWNIFVAPLVLRALAKPTDQILLGKEFVAWAEEGFKKEWPRHWSEEKGGLGVGMLLTQRPGGQETWTFVIHHQSRLAARIGKGLLDDIGGMLLERRRQEIDVTLNLVIALDGASHRPAGKASDDILKVYRRVFSSQSEVCNWDRTRRMTLAGARVRMEYGMVASVRNPPAQWKVWTSTNRDREKITAQSLQTLIDINNSGGRLP